MGVKKIIPIILEQLIETKVYARCIVTCAIITFGVELIRHDARFFLDSYHS